MFSPFSGALAADDLEAAAAAAAAIAFGSIPPPVNDGKAWRIVRTEWSEADEQGYSAFVQAIGWASCTSLDSCLNSPANPYRHTDDKEYTGDCADMAYVLRAYYAWKNGLPFSYQSAMRTADGSAEDTRYSTNGNRVAGRRSAIGPTPVSGPDFIGRIAGEVSTAMFRTHPVKGAGNSHDDFYPVSLTREAVRPGVLAYDIYGHVGIVYDVLADGRVLVVASHPDFSVSRTIYGPNFLRSKPELGAGLKAWRPIRLEGATRRPDGTYAGGRIAAAPNESLPYFSLEQHYGTVPPPEGAEWHQGEFRIGGRTFSYYDFVRRRLAAPGFAHDPVKDFRNGLQAICASIRDRKYAVERATGSKVHLRPHPGRLPPNIFGTYGDWEAYSTPSRDARLKVQFIELRRGVQDMVESVAAGGGEYGYEGDDLPADLWKAFVEEKDACEFTYWRADDSRVRLNLAHVMDRLWKLSFDPFHCPERRWGADGAELATCTDDAVKTRWYNAQRFLRYQAERTYDVRMDFTLEQLKPPMVARPEDGGLGVEAPADADIRAYLLTLNRMPMASLEPREGILVSAGDRAAPEPRFPEWHYKIENRIGGWKPAGK